MNHCKQNGIYCEFANLIGDCVITVCTKTFNTQRETILLKDSATLGVGCIICGESVPLTPNEIIMLEQGHGRQISSKVCDKCKQAVLHMREQMR